jgi:urease accessory protein
MISPFPPSSSAPGEGHLIVQLLPHAISALSKITFQYPLKLISPSPRAGQKSVLVFFLTYGGGLVGGDQVNLTIDVKANAKLSIVTQGHTKIFKCPSRDVTTRQQLQVTIHEGAAVCLLPDPIQPFEGSIYEQSQRFTICEGGSLCLLDWISAGRTARGEDWDLGAWSGRNEVWTAAQTDKKARLLLRDNVILEGDEIGAREKLLKKKMHGLGIFGTLVLRGPMLDPLADFLLAEFSTLPRIGARDFRSQDKMDKDSELVLSKQETWRMNRLKQEKEDGLLWSAAKVRGCTVVKFGARAVEGGRNWVGSMLKEEGSIGRQFGDEATMCVR